MPRVDGHRPGWPCWAELATPDLRVSHRFYSELFGWGRYTVVVPHRGEIDVFTCGEDDAEVAALQQLADPAQPASWTCYFRTDDMARSVEAVRRAGGQVLIEPVEHGNLGLSAMFVDPEGADFCVVDTYDFPGARVVEESSSPVWIELAVHDLAAERGFYGEVFGWRPVDRDYGALPYTEFKVGDESVAGMVAMDELRAAAESSHWMPYVEVADCDAAAARASELGARIQVGPTTVEPGRYAVLADPTGARLGIITPDPVVRRSFRTAP